LVGITLLLRALKVPSKVIRVRYERGAFRPLEPLDLAEGEEFVVKIVDVKSRKRILEKYKGVLEPVDSKLIEEAIEEAEHT